MLDILLYILFDATVEGSVDTRLPKGLRYTLLTILSIMFFGCVIGLICVGVGRLRNSTTEGVIFIISGVGILVSGLIWYFSAMKRMKNKKPEENEGE